METGLPGVQQSCRGAPPRANKSLSRSRSTSSEGLPFASGLDLLGCDLMGCLATKHADHSRRSLDVKDAVALAAETSCGKVDLPDCVNIATGTPFTVSKVEALYDLSKKLSNSIIKDGFIHKEEFQLALIRNNKKQNLFVDRLKVMVLALLDESDLNITSDAVEMIVDRTFNQADTKGDGRIDREEWDEIAKNSPHVLRNMSVPYLKDITTAFPSFVIHSEISEADMAV